MRNHFSVLKSCILIAFFLIVEVMPILGSYVDSGTVCTEFKIKLSKDTYLVSEPIWLELEMNVDSICVIVNQPYLIIGTDVGLTLKNEKGEQIPYAGGISDIHFPQKMYNKHILNWYNVLVGYGNFVVRSSKFLPSGNYILYATYRFNSKDGYKEIISNTVGFRVIEPEREEALAREKWFAIEKGKKDNKSEYELKELVDSFIVQYPTSVYRDKVISTTIISYPAYVELLSDAEKEQFVLKQIRDFPGSYYNSYYIEYLGFLQQYISNYDEYLSLMEQLPNDPLLVRIVQQEKMKVMSLKKEDKKNK